MKAFWRSKEELTPEESQLLMKLFEAHHKSCFRDNASSVAVTIAADASGDLSKAIIAGLATMGGKHAPVEETVRFLSLDYPEAEVDWILKRGQKVPGWGGTYQKDKPDPLWLEVNQLIPETLSKKLKVVTSQLHQRGKIIWPNPSAYTACVAITLGIPPALASWLFIYGRISGWTQLATRYLGA